jgi:hypothetical protein
MKLQPLLALILTANLSAQTVALKQTENSLRVEIGGQLFTEYRSDAQRPYMYPLTGPSGANLARPYPMEKGGAEDHPHHRSLWFTHGGVNGVDFWGNGEKNGTQKHLGFEEIQSADSSSASFVTKTSWLLPSGDEVLADKRLIRVEALPEGGKIIDHTITMTATQGDAVFTDTKEGSFAIRVGPTLSMKKSEGAAGHITTSEGAKDAKAWGTRAKWVTFHGPDQKGEAVSITIFDHPQNLRHPTWWHVRDYGLFAANPFGIHDFEKSDDKTKGNHTLPKGESMTQRYRVLIQKGEPDQAKLAEVFIAYATAN